MDENGDLRTKKRTDHWLSIDSSLQKIKYQCKWTGLNIENKKRTTLQNFIYGFNLILQNMDIVGSFFWFYEGAKSGKSFTELTYVAPCITLSILTDFKTGYLIAYEEQMFQLLDNLRKFEGKIRENMTDDEEKLVRPDMMFLNNVIKVLNILFILMVIVFDLTPLMLVGVTYLRTNELKPLLPYLDIYPFGSYDLRYWPYSYLHAIWMGKK